MPRLFIEDVSNELLPEYRSFPAGGAGGIRTRGMYVPSLIREAFSKVNVMKNDLISAPYAGKLFSARRCTAV